MICRCCPPPPRTHTPPLCEAVLCKGTWVICHGSTNPLSSLHQWMSQCSGDLRSWRMRWGLMNLWIGLDLKQSVLSSCACKRETFSWFIIYLEDRDCCRIKCIFRQSVIIKQLLKCLGKWPHTALSWQTSWVIWLLVHMALDRFPWNQVPGIRDWRFSVLQQFPQHLILSGTWWPGKTYWQLVGNN